MPAVGDLAALPAFDPQAGTVIRAPEKPQAGYWAGAPGVFYHPGEQVFYLTYRVRRPRGEKSDRGAELHLAKSSDGFAFDDIYVLKKEELPSPSIERCSLSLDAQGEFLFYLSYVDADDDRWKIDVLRSPDPSRWNLSERDEVFHADDIGAEGVKDPWIMKLGGIYWMILSYATRDAPAEDDQLHGTADVYNTGLIKSRSGLATSLDGLTFDWQGDLLSPGDESWDEYAARLSCLFPRGPLWVGLYDGSASVDENYEERLGLALGSDFRRLTRVSVEKPWILGAGKTQSVRYADVVMLENNKALVYYELALENGSHDLRVQEWNFG